MLGFEHSDHLCPKKKRTRMEFDSAILHFTSPSIILSAPLKLNELQTITLPRPYLYFFRSNASLYTSPWRRQTGRTASDPNRLIFVFCHQIIISPKYLSFFSCANFKQPRQCLEFSSDFLRGSRKLISSRKMLDCFKSFSTHISFLLN